MKSATSLTAPSTGYSILNTIFFQFCRGYVLGNDIYRQVIGIPMGTNSAPLVADLFMFSLSPDNQPDIIQAFNGTSRY